jgi:hypothetical protein
MQLGNDPIMNKLVLEHYPASRLPAALRRGLSADATVRVTVEEEPSGSSIHDLERQLREYRSRNPDRVSIEQGVARIRQLRDEWDD